MMNSVCGFQRITMTDSEINRTVAEKVMGWTINIFKEEAPGVPLYGGNLWQPTSDPIASRMVIEKMQEQKYEWEIESECGEWRVLVYHQSKIGKNGLGINTRLDTAICLATLQVCGREDE